MDMANLLVHCTQSITLALGESSLLNVVYSVHM